MNASEYELHLQLLKSAAADERQRSGEISSQWLGRDMSDLQHEVWCAVHRCGLMTQDRTGFHRLTAYGRIYLEQRLSA